MSILVTGSRGFLGKALMKRLGSEAIAFEGDVCEAQAFELYNQMKHVFHLASKTFVPKSWQDPHSFYKTSLLGTLNVLQFCQRTQSSLTYVSSYIYGAADRFPIDEKAAPKPHNPYAHGKHLAEQLCEYYSLNLGVKIIILRPFNIYGPEQGTDFLIPTLIRQLQNPTMSIGHATPKRDYVFVEDVVDALLLSMHRTEPFNIYNIGSGKSASVLEVAQMLKKLSGSQAEISYTNIPRKNEIADTQANIEKACSELGWTPKTSLEEGLKRLL